MGGFQAGMHVARLETKVDQIARALELLDKDIQTIFAYIEAQKPKDDKKESDNAPRR